MPPKTRAAQQAEEAHTVRSRPGRSGFHAPDIPHLDVHLRRLSQQVRAATLTDAGRHRLWDDMNSLLERRYQLMWFERGLDVS